MSTLGVFSPLSPSVSLFALVSPCFRRNLKWPWPWGKINLTTYMASVTSDLFCIGGVGHDYGQLLATLLLRHQCWHSRLTMQGWSLCFHSVSNCDELNVTREQGHCQKGKKKTDFIITQDCHYMLKPTSRVMDFKEAIAFTAPDLKEFCFTLSDSFLTICWPQIPAPNLVVL